MENRTERGPVYVGEATLFENWEKLLPHHKVEVVEVHPKRNLELRTNDLAIIKVSVPFNFSKNIQPIPIGNLSVDRIHENETVNVLELKTKINIYLVFF